MLTWKWGKPLLQSFSNQPQRGYIEITPDAGTPFRRLTFSDISDVVSCSFSITRQDYPLLYSWYKYDLRQGTLPFEIYDCRYGVNRVARLINDVPGFQTNSNRYNLSLAMALEPTIIYKDRALAEGLNFALVVNDNNYLTVGFGLRI